MRTHQRLRGIQGRNAASPARRPGSSLFKGRFAPPALAPSGAPVGPLSLAGVPRHPNPYPYGSR
jgi:hypothetical protein